MVIVAITTRSKVRDTIAITRVEMIVVVVVGMIVVIVVGGSSVSRGLLVGDGAPVERLFASGLSGELIQFTVADVLTSTKQSIGSSESKPSS